MQAYICTVCGFLYDEQSAHIGPDGKKIPFDQLDFEWGCPICGVKATLFIPVESDRVPDIPNSEGEK